MSRGNGCRIHEILIEEDLESVWGRSTVRIKTLARGIPEVAALQVHFSTFINGLDVSGIECDSNVQRALSWEG